MIRPVRARIIGRSARRISRKAADRSVSITESHASSLIDGARSSALIPALLTSTSTGRSNAISTCSNSRSGVAGSTTSPASATARPPAAAIDSTTPSAAPASLR